MNTSPIKLVVRGIGNVPSFKNNKMMARGRLITDPKKQKWMEQCTLRLEYALLSMFRTRGIETLTAVRPPSWIASWLPLDDSCKWIGTLCVDLRKAKKGDEGFEIEISHDK